MGLDQYIYRIEPAEKDVIKRFSGADVNTIPNTYTWFGIDWEYQKEKIENVAMVKDLLKVGHIVPVKRSVFNSDRLFEDFNIPDGEIKWVSTENKNDGIEKTVQLKNGEKKIIDLPWDKCRKYSDSVDEEVIITGECNNIYYWRKNWPLDEAISEYIHETRNVCTENCGFYRLDDDLIELIARNDSAFEDFAVNNELSEDDNLFYHLWF